MGGFRSDEKNKDLALLENIEKYLLHKVRGSVTLDELCRLFCVSRSSLCRKWKEHTGKGVLEYFLHLKIKEAQHLLEEDRFTITQISEMLSYPSIHHFSYSFKKYNGLTPSEYRESYKSCK